LTHGSHLVLPYFTAKNQFFQKYAGEIQACLFFSDFIIYMSSDFGCFSTGAKMQGT